MPRVLILSASVGSGHLRAAQAVELAVRRLRPTAIVRNVDVLAFATAAFRFSFADVYLGLIQHAPQLLGYIYGLFDRPVRPTYGPMYKLKVALERMNLRPLVELLTVEPWDLVINTFFLSAEIVAALRRQGRLTAPQVQVITDFESHRNWVNHPCELYCTATEESAQYLTYFGVPRSAAVATGIPIHPDFAEPWDRAACRMHQGLIDDRRVVLLLAGGHGVGPLGRIYRALLDVTLPLQIVVVTGRNEGARRRLAATPAPARHRVQVRGFTDEMDHLLAAADLVVTKPGGLTTAEALARGVGVVVVNPVPGQEERNSDYLLENGAGIKVNHVPTLALKVEALLRDAGRLSRMRAAARRLARPRASFDVAELALGLLEKPPNPPAPFPKSEGGEISRRILTSKSMSLNSPPLPS